MTCKLGWVWGMLGVVGLVTGCGKQAPSSGGFVSGADLFTYIQNEDTYAQLSVNLNTQGFLVDGVTIPIADPKDPTVELGSIGFQPDLNNPSGNILTLTLNLTVTAGSQNIDGTLLPNGTALPVSGLTGQPVLGLTAGSSRVYLALTDTIAVIGAAVVIKQFDSVGTISPTPVDLFPSFNVAKKVTGVAGLFTGPNTGESGVGLFFDLSPVWHPGSSGATAVGMGGEVPSDQDEVNLFNSLAALRSKSVHVNAI